MTIDDAAHAEAAVAGAAVILVTSEPNDRHPSWFIRIPPEQLEMILASNPPAVQPGQLWLLGTEAVDCIAACREAIRSWQQRAATAADARDLLHAERGVL